MGYLHGKFVWFENVSHDIPAARRFYDTLFGWRSDAVDIGDGFLYHLIMHGADAIGGYRVAAPEVASHWLSFLSVADVEATAALAIAAGGRELTPPTELPPMGRGACLADPTGAVFFVWTSGEGDRPDLAPTPPGDWCWNELLTPAPATAVDFYTRVFGYHSEAMDLGEGGRYHLLKRGAVARAGIMLAPTPESPAHWLPYVAVADPEATADKAHRLGARTVVAPREIPGIGRFAVFVDPLGASFAVFRPAARA